MNKKITNRHYFVTQQNDVQYSWTKMNTIVLPSSKKKVNGQAPKQSGILTRYNFRADPMLGIGNIAVRRIPCACEECLKQLALDWESGKENKDQQRYAQNKNCEKWDVFQGENDWEIAEIKFMEGHEEEVMKELPSMVLKDLTTSVGMLVEVGSFGVLNVDEDKPYVLVQFCSKPYILEDKLDGDDTDQIFELKEGDNVVEVMYWKSLSIRRDGGEWFTPLEQRSVVRLQHIVEPNLNVLPVSSGNPLPRGFPQGSPPLQNAINSKRKRSPQELSILGKAMLVSAESIKMITAEIERRECFDYEIGQEEMEWKMVENYDEEVEEDELYSSVRF